MQKECFAMDNKIRLADNIRLLRNASGETQEELGAILNLEKNTISSYECGKREPNKATISNIAMHYMISVEELLFSDLSYLERLSYDTNAFGKNIGVILPMVSSEAAIENKHFKKAYDCQCALYNSFRQNKINELSRIDFCMEEYSLAYENANISPESAANMLALIYLTQLLKTVPHLIENRSAPLLLMMSQDPAIKKAIESTDETNHDSMVKEIKFAECFSDPNFYELLDTLKTEVKKSKDWSDLADYYIALQYLWNLEKNDMDSAFNRRVGLEMLSALISVGNTYAEQYAMFVADATGQSSQTVDDKT